MEDRLNLALTPDDCELLALTRVHPRHRRLESQLAANRWFDYRRRHPVELTYQFAADYEAAIREIHAETKDLDEAERIEVIKGEKDVFRRADLLLFWRARQVADAIGCPYTFLCRFGMKRAAARGWGYFPRPNQFTAEDLVLDARDAWRKAIKEIYHSASDPFYLVKNDVGHPDQAAYRRWLLARIQERQRPEFALARAFREGHLLPSHVRGEHFDAVINEAAKLGGVPAAV
jgi:hypothetical protein